MKNPGTHVGLLSTTPSGGGVGQANRVQAPVLCLGTTSSPEQRDMHMRGSPDLDLDHADQATVLWWLGKRSMVICDHNGLLLEHLQQPGSCLPWARSGTSVQFVPYSEILSCRYLPVRRYCPTFSSCQRQLHYCELKVLSRQPGRPWQWSLRSLELAAEQPDLLKHWVGHVRDRLQQLTYRPRRLLVFVNPYGGKRKARHTWQQLSAPILAAAGVECEVVETEYQGHAQAVTSALSLQQLAQLDGVVAVGGDGLFSELLTAVLQHRHLAAALQLRLGHIPAGSTDAVACTLHGTRDPVTAALHIALGDCTPLDVGLMATLPPQTPTQAATPAAAPNKAAVPGGLLRASEATPDSVTAAAGAQTAAAAGGREPISAAAAVPAVGAYPGLSVGSHSELLLHQAEASSDRQVAAGPTSSSSGDGGGQAGMQGAAADGSELGQLAATPTNNSSGRPAAHGRQERRRQQQQHRKQRQGSPPASQEQQSDALSVFVQQLRHFVCVANYGFLGDVMTTSEKLRWMGPIRYDVAGALRWLLLRQYKATVWYKPAPEHAATSSSGGGSGAAAGATGAHKQHRGTRAGDTLLPPAAVAPLPHHQQPSLHAKLAGAAAAPAHTCQHHQHHHQQQQQHACCSSGGSSRCGSRRNSADGMSGPLLSVAEGAAVSAALGNPVGTAGAAGYGDGGGGNRSSAQQLVAAPASVLSAAVAAMGLHSNGSSTAADEMAAQRASVDAGAAGDSSIDERLPQPPQIQLPHQQQPQQQQQQGKTVSFWPPQVSPAVTASGASFSSSRGSGSTSLGGAAVAWVTSRANSVTSAASGSRCSSRCARCAAAALHHSSSRQSFTSIGQVQLGSADDAASSSTAAWQPGDMAEKGAAGADVAAGSGSAAAAAQSSTPAKASSAADASSSHTSGGSSGSSGSGPPGPGWVKVEGRFASIMCVVTSCISDKSRQGLMPEAHLADGRLALVLVEGCSRLQYLRFLLQLASKGIVPGSLPFMRVEYATEVQVETEERGQHSRSSWNVDGELLRHGRVNVGIHAGLVDVFARGVELM